MRSIYGLFLAAFLLFSAPGGIAEVQKTDMQQVKNQMAERLCKPSPAADKNASRWLGTLKGDGTWGDLHYADQTRGAWSPSFHLIRVLDMARAYAAPQSPLHGDPALGRAIHSALGHWLAKDYRCPNWWYNEIGVPRDMASILLLIENELSAQEKAAGLKIVERGKIGMTGQNRVWLAEITLMRGLLEADAALVQSARDIIVSEIVVSTAEGVQPDWSFHQHGAQQQLGNYGLAFATDSAEWAEILRGTAFALNASQMEILRQYLLQGERYVFWKGEMDISSCGRQLTPHSPAGKCRAYLGALKTMQRVDPDHAAEYQAAVDSSLTQPGNAFVAHKHFWRSDYMVDRRAGYYASVKMSSRRVIGSELVNEENLQGFYLGDGALYLYQSGGEYEDIFPVWDWRKLPGITAAQLGGPLPPPKERIDSDFVGGVSDGHNGAAVLDYRRDGVAAKKSWFFFEGRIVCLGAGIASDKEAPVVTSVAQCLQRGDVKMGQQNALSTVAVGRKEYPAVEWAWHDGVGYVFPTPEKVTLGSAPQQGAWKSVFISGSAAPITKDVFALWMDHGTKPQNGAYRYVLLPSVTAEQVQAFRKNPDVQWLSNTTALQAVQCGGIAMAVFYQPGKLVYAPGHQIEVNQPCLVMVQETAQGPKLTLADPTQKLQSVGVVLNGKATTVALPQGPNAGSSVVGQ